MGFELLTFHVVLLIVPLCFDVLDLRLAYWEFLACFYIPVLWDLGCHDWFS